MNGLEVLRSLGRGSGPSPEAEQRIRQRVLSGIAVTSLAPVNDGSGALARGLFWRSKPAAMLVSWLIGGGMGAAIYGALRPPEIRVKSEQSSPQNQPQLVASRQIAPATTVVNAAPSAPPAARPLGSGSGRLTPPRSLRTASGLAEERALLDTARAMAARGDSEQVLNQTERHRTDHPNGRLSEEREALSIQALLKLGRNEEARIRARAFQEKYPNSLMGVAIESALAP